MRFIRNDYRFLFSFLYNLFNLFNSYQLGKKSDELKNNHSIYKVLFAQNIIQKWFSKARWPCSCFAGIFYVTVFENEKSNDVTNNLTYKNTKRNYNDFYREWLSSFQVWSEKWGERRYKKYF